MNASELTRIEAEINAAIEKGNSGTGDIKASYRPWTVVYYNGVIYHFEVKNGHLVREHCNLDGAVALFSGHLTPHDIATAR